ncbi:MAG: phosphoglycerate mutase (2,3-diphosphoglycerate-independent) [Flavobacteriaceae bacterium]|nr:phosphoglycerate mutase (2,3-diphosphoglycerate-independent) [Flavobacteriaceae bacterium]|tara:strand:+ start:25129 stop:26640 length:1512 start_codon:yes stop_codon:yes gene_type:complete
MSKALLMILDGWGITKDPTISAIDIAKTPFIDNLCKNYSHSKLITDGLNVGLPEGQMGNSEVGHMNIGAGRIINQDLAKINLSIKNKSLERKEILTKTFKYAKEQNKKIHFIGLFSNGGVHSHIQHLMEILEIAWKNNLTKVYIHLFSDGRDCDPKSLIKFIKSIIPLLKKSGFEIASLIGRYYAMDRDNRYDRTKKAYDLLVNGVGEKSENLINTINSKYKEGITDEFLPPIICYKNNSPITKIKEKDVVFFFNFRNDRAKQLTRVLTQKPFPKYGMKPLDLCFLTLTNYDSLFKKIKVIFDKKNLKDTLGEVISKAGKTQLRIAETEKYPHVTYFFNGGRELPFKGENRILCPSPKVSTYDLKPEMSAFDIKNAIIPKIKIESPDFICLNFANPDMVGHTGNLKAAIKACEVVDKCVEEVISTALKYGYISIIIADHGNCEKMVNPDGSPNTSHTTNPVPIIFVDPKKRKIRNGILGNIAPTILKILNINKPKSMTENSLL